MTDPAAVADRLELVHERIRRAGGSPAALTIVAVTKGFGADAVAVAPAAGLSDVGENYAQELEAKWEPGPIWHFLGGVQRNKVADLAPRVDVWQSVDRIEEATAIAARAPGAQVFVQVNASGDPQKGGCHWDDAPVVVDHARTAGLAVRGLMVVGPAGGAEDARPGFRRAAALAADLGLDELSMGMTGDLEVAVQEGSTMLRVGTALFGVRPTPTRLRR